MILDFGKVQVVMGLIGGLARTATAGDVDDVPEIVYLDLPRSAADPAGVAPAGQIVEAWAIGDLDSDGDGAADLVVMLHGTNPRHVIRAGAGPDAKTLDTNSRILAVALGDGRRGDFRLTLETRALHSTPYEFDPGRSFRGEGSLALRDGAILIKLGYFSSAWGWDAGHRTLLARHRTGAFVLAGLKGKRSY